MTISLKNMVFVLSLISLFFLSQPSSAQHLVELTPGLSVMEAHDDNIYLESTDENSDYITTVSPSLSLHLLSENTHLQLAYAPTFVWYDKEDQNDTVRHSGTATFGQDLAEHLRFDLTDTYMKSEEPMEEAEEVENVRHTRDTYQRNAFSASFGCLFGPEDAFTVGFRHSLLKNEDPAVDDGKIRNPFSTVTYWFNATHGMEVDYEHTKAIFWRNDASEAGDDYTGHGAGMRYIHRFTPHARGSLGYHFTNRDFQGPTEDYNVHEGSVAFEKAFSPDLSVSLGCGYFVQENEESDNQTGYTYDASVNKSFERGSFSIGGSGGWDEAYLEAERRGFTRYWSILAQLQYQVTESLDCYAGWSFRLDKGQDQERGNRRWETWGRTCGLRWTFLRWFSLSLDYSYGDRDDDVDTEDYKVNRIMLNLSASRLWRW